MSRKVIIISVLCLVLAVTAMIAMLFAPSFYNSEISLPTYLSNVDKLVVNNSMTIVRKMGVWCSQDDDCYPVDNDVVDMLMDNLQEASLYAQRCYDQCDGTNEIVLISQNGEKVSLLFDADNGYTKKIMAIYKGKNVLLEGDFFVPSQPYQWFEQPLIKLSNADIEEISGVEPENFNFDELVFYQASKSNDFAEWEAKQINIVLKNGLIADFIVYAKSHSYWISLSLETTVMPTKDAFEYAKNTAQLYDGWFFELPQPLGNKLFGISEKRYIRR